MYIDPLLAGLLDQVKKRVINRDNDYVMVIDGEEGSGKSVLAMNIAKYLDPSFDLNDIVFTAEDFMNRVKTAPKYKTILLDEAYNSANSRASLTSTNRAMACVSTEMRQQNLFVIIVLPSFFDLDKHFALHRTKSLFHTYLTEEGKRGQFIVFPKNEKRLLYLFGKKTYSYSKPNSPLPAMRFNKYYPVDEEEYRNKKREAFKSRGIKQESPNHKWKLQRDALIRYFYRKGDIKYKDFVDIFDKEGIKGITEKQIGNIVTLYN